MEHSCPDFGNRIVSQLPHAAAVSVVTSRVRAQSLKPEAPQTGGPVLQGPAKLFSK